MNPATRECPEDVSFEMVHARRFFKLLFDNIYSSSDNYGRYSEELKCFTTDGELNVELDLIYDPGEEIGLKTGVYIGFGDMVFDKSVVNYSAGATEDMSTEMFTVTAKIPFQIQHIAVSADTCYQLAHISLDAVIGLKEFIKKRLGLRGLTIGQMSRPQEIAKSPDKFFTVDLSGLLEFNYVVNSAIQSHRLKKVMVSKITESYH